MQLFLNVLVFDVWLPKGENQKRRGESGCSPFKSLGVLELEGEGLQQCPPPLSPCDQSTDPWYVEDRVLFAHPSSCKLCVSCSRTPAQRPVLGVGVGGRMGSCICSQSGNCLKLTTMYSPSLPLEVVKTSTDFRIPKWLHQSDSASAIVFQVGRQIPGASYPMFPESSFQLLADPLGIHVHVRA